MTDPATEAITESTARSRFSRRASVFKSAAPLQRLAYKSVDQLNRSDGEPPENPIVPTWSSLEWNQQQIRADLGELRAELHSGIDEGRIGASLV